MKSSFWHVGINKTLETYSRRLSQDNVLAPRVQHNGSIQFKPLPNHVDPDFQNLTYGEPWGRVDKLEPGDVAFFIESATSDEWLTWSYFVIAYFVVERIYKFSSNEWYPEISSAEDKIRIDQNAHKLRGDSAFSILLGVREKSRLLFQRPFRMSDAQKPIEEVRVVLGLDNKKQLVGYWWKKWFDGVETELFLKLLGWP
ncbi:MAG: hypothetical protein ACYCPW_00390 [Nitrososphaerales archaeon]